MTILDHIPILKPRLNGIPQMTDNKVVNGMTVKEVFENTFSY